MTARPFPMPKVAGSSPVARSSKPPHVWGFLALWLRERPFA